LLKLFHIKLNLLISIKKKKRRDKIQNQKIWQELKSDTTRKAGQITDSMVRTCAMHEQQQGSSRASKMKTSNKHPAETKAKVEKPSEARSTKESRGRVVTGT
jgi:hypothetical protein